MDGVRSSSVLAVILFGAGAARGAQSSEPLTESRVRGFARQADREAKGDATETVLTLDRLVRERLGDFESFPLSVVRNDEILVTVTAPYMAFRRSLIDILRAGRP